MLRPDDAAARLLLALDPRDDVALAGLLDARVRLTIDSGDSSGGERTGRTAVARELVARLLHHPDAALEIVHVNGAPGLAIRRPNGDVTGLISLRSGWRGRIVELWVTTAPGKLACWNRVGGN
ncbi:hypothetical protein BCL57_000221 [Agromyces flavus]|uniref:SnoaL-like domain-containing protein n=1 Tax=Agromyces flavus TaxID=589382 RepID=A0ABT1KGS7_9MICO|nr:hypothetical protein [Agromyces flavus]MCP2366079.1 hypothetical protein [Agromyces flavus]GGI43961.1 hypothetical protein GCM10010932_02210 [Agromyces flavus]